MLTFDRNRIAPSNRKFRSMASVILAVVLTMAANASYARQNPAAPQLPLGVEIKIQAKPLQATVGDRIQIDYDLVYPKGCHFQFPSLPGQLGEFTVLETLPGPVLPGPQAPAPQIQEVQHHQARLIVAVYRPGEFEFPALPFVLQDATGKQVEMPSPTVRIRIESVLTEENPDLRDLKKQADLEAAANWLLWLALLGLAAILAVLAWRWLRRRPRISFHPSVQPDVDPLDVAEAEMQALLELGLLDKGMIKQFYVRLSEIIKKALEASYGIQTVEKTTSEIVAALSALPAGEGAALESAGLELVETLLLSCDMVKFARYLPSRPESEEAISEAARILTACRARRQAAIPAAAPAGGVS